MKLKHLFQMSVIKTIVFNIHYFKWGRIPVIIAKNVKFKNLEGTIECKGGNASVFIGFGNPGIADFKTEKVIFQNSGKMVFEGTASFSPGCKIVNSGEIFLGNHFDIKSRSALICEKRLSIGNNVLISWDCMIMDTDMHKIKNAKGLTTNNPTEIIIEDNVWVGCRSIILKGSRVSSGSIIGAGSVVRKKHMESNSIYINDDAVRSEIYWEK